MRKFRIALPFLLLVHSGALLALDGVTADKVTTGMTELTAKNGASVLVKPNTIGVTSPTGGSPVITKNFAPLNAVTPPPGDKSNAAAKSSSNANDNAPSGKSAQNGGDKAAGTGKNGSGSSDEKPASSSGDSTSTSSTGSSNVGDKAAGSSTTSPSSQTSAAATSSPPTSESPSDTVRTNVAADVRTSIAVTNTNLSSSSTPVSREVEAPAPAPTTQTTTVTLTNSTTGTTLGVTSGTQTSSTGQTTSLANPVLPYSTQAQAAASAAVTAAGTTDFPLSLTTTSAATAVSALNSSVAGITSALSSVANTASQASAAQTAFAANGTFADSSATAANNAVKTASAALQSAQTAVNGALSTANTSLNSAGAALSSANTQLANIVTYQGAISSNQAILGNSATSKQTLQAAGLAVITTPPTTLQGMVSLVKTAANQATALQAAGDLVGAQAALATALAAQNIVNSSLSANASVNSAVSAASSASSALSSISTQLASVSSNAATISSNYLTAQYSNPAYATVNNFGHETVAPIAVTGGSNAANSWDTAQPGTSYVLDGSKNLVEIRGGKYDGLAGSTFMPVQALLNVDSKITGGVAKDSYMAADSSIYMGRWQGGTMTVTDLAATAPVAPLTSTLGSSSLHWIISANPSAGYVQTLAGTANYALAAATHPTDALGNVGTLASATLAANFTAQTVGLGLNVNFSTADLVNVSTKNKAFTVSASAIPISAETVFSQSLPAACAGAGCDVNAYNSTVWARFSGNNAANVAMAYNIYAAPTTAVAGTAPAFTDIVQGAAVLTAATVPAVAPLAAYAPTLVAIGWSVPGFTNNQYSLIPSADITYTGGTPSSYIDRWGCAGTGCNGSSTYSILGAASPVNGNATSFAATGIKFGRWTTSSAAQTSNVNIMGTANNTPTSWMYGPQGYLDSAVVAGVNTGPLSGIFSYALDSASAPFDRKTGASGTLTSASLSANFTNQTVNASLALTVGGQNWAASATNIGLNPTSYNQFNASTATNNLSLTLAGGVCATCGGNLAGAFTGQNFAGAILSYNLWDTATSGSNNGIVGNAALTRNVAGNPAVTAVTPAPTGKYFIADIWGGNILWADTITTTATATGNLLTGYTQGSPAVPSAGYGSGTVTCTTCTALTAGQAATSGIYYGNWTSATYTNTYGGSVSPAQPHWISGPEVGPIYLAQVLTGTVNFALDGGTAPTNQAGAAGTLNSASLAVNFTKQTVGINLNVSAPSTVGSPSTLTWNAYTAAGNEARLQGTNGIGNTSFSAYGNPGSTAAGPGVLTVTLTNSLSPTVTASAGGAVSGQLTGTGLNGALLGYNFYQSSVSPMAGNEQVNGVAAFAAPASNTATPYRFVGVSLTGFGNGGNSTAGAEFNAVSRVTADAAGNLTAFDINPFSNANSTQKTIANVTSTLSNLGTDAATGITWGRWQGGTINAADRATGAASTQTVQGSIHWIATPAMTGPVTLPTSGIFPYTLAGGTTPTDNLGNAGTLNSANLTANFTAQTVDVGVNATVNGANLIASATAVPIIQKTAFQASNSPAVGNGSGGTLTVSCTGTNCGAPTAHITGAFIGAGGTGVGIMYGFQKAGIAANLGNSISGVAAFHR